MWQQYFHGCVGRVGTIAAVGGDLISLLHPRSRCILCDVVFIFNSSECVYSLCSFVRSSGACRCPRCALRDEPRRRWLGGVGCFGLGCRLCLFAPVRSFSLLTVDVRARVQSGAFGFSFAFSPHFFSFLSFASLSGNRACAVNKSCRRPGGRIVFEPR